MPNSTRLAELATRPLANHFPCCSLLWSWKLLWRGQISMLDWPLANHLFLHALMLDPLWFTAEVFPKDLTFGPKKKKNQTTHKAVDLWDPGSSMNDYLESSNPYLKALRFSSKHANKYTYILLKLLINNIFHTIQKGFW